MLDNRDIFTVEEINLMCILNVAGNRTALTRELTVLMLIGDAELVDLADSAITKLNRMSDDEFAALKLYPEYGEHEEEA